jgi:hypothetical protein
LSLLCEFPCSNQASSMLANEQSSLIAYAKWAAARWERSRMN